MVRRLAEELADIENAVRAQPRGIAATEIAAELPVKIPRRTLQYRLKVLTDEKRIVKEGEGRWVKYRLPSLGASAEIAEAPDQLEAQAERSIPLSEAGKEIRDLVRRQIEARRPVGYDRTFLDSYQENVSSYLSSAERALLKSEAQFEPSAAINEDPVNSVEIATAPAGTYAKQILSRLLIDLSWNSSRLEGNTYSLLDTRRLIAFGREAEGRDRRDAQMILNHKEAIEFLVGGGDEIGFNRYTILNLHAMLANNLLADEAAAGRLRHIEVGIAKSAFHPLANPQAIEECFDRILRTASAIENTFEQSLFVMVQLPYLQPFDDVNKRVSRLAANIPFIKRNLPPLSFTDVPRRVYTDALLGVYELNRIDLLRDTFLWAYRRSAERYRAVRQSLGEPDPFRFRHRESLRRVVSDIVQDGMGKERALAHIESSAAALPEDEQERFKETAADELLALHEGNFARYRITPGQFESWIRLWKT